MRYQNQQVHIGVLKYTIHSTYLPRFSANHMVVCNISMYLPFVMHLHADANMIGRKM
jgi:hypothetical protein